MKMGFLQRKNYLTINFAQNYPPSSSSFHKIETTHSLPNIPQGNTARICTDEQNLCDKKALL